MRQVTGTVSILPFGRWITSDRSIRGVILSRPSDVDHLLAGDAERLAVHAFLEDQRQHAHADQVRAMDALETLDDDRLDAEQQRALRRPVARRAGAVFLAAEHHQRHALGLVAHRRVIDRHLLAGRQMLGHAAFDVGQHLVADADVGERAAHHDLVVAAPRAVAVEILLQHLAFQQIFAGRRDLADRARRADVVGGDRNHPAPPGHARP